MTTVPTGDRPRATLLTQYFPPETFAGANRARALAAAVSETHELTVLGLHPAYPNEGCYNPDATALVDAAATFAIRRRSRFAPHRYRHPLSRAVGEQWAALRIGMRALRLPAEVIITSSPSMFLGPVALAVARVKRAEFVWDVRDVTWTMALETIRGNAAVRFLARALHSALWATARRCDVLVAATPGIAQMAAEAGVSEDRIALVENGITEQMRNSLATIRSREPRPRAVVTYVGLLGQAQALTALVEAAYRLPDVDFVIVGEGPQRGALVARIDELGCGNVHLTGYVEPEQLPRLFADSDVLFAQVVDSPTLNQTARPSKLLEYMAAGRAVVYAGHGSAAALIEDVGCGVSVSPGDPDAIAAAIGHLLEDHSRLDELGRRGADFVDTLPSRDRRMQDLAKLLRARSIPVKVVR